MMLCILHYPQFQDIIPFLKLIGDHFNRGGFGDHFRGGDYFEVGVISGVVQIPFVSVIPDFLSCFPDFKAQEFGFRWQNFMDFGFHKEEFSGFRNPYSLKWGESLKVMMRQLSLYTLACEDTENARKGKKTERQKELPVPQLKSFKSLSVGVTMKRCLFSAPSQRIGL